MTGGYPTTQEGTDHTAQKGSSTIQADAGKTDICERAVGTIVQDDHLQSRRT